MHDDGLQRLTKAWQARVVKLHAGADMYAADCLPKKGLSWATAVVNVQIVALMVAGRLAAAQQL
jgi:hypothetical protein